MNAFGVYQTYYEDSFLSSQGASNISWIGSVQAFLLVFIGVITGPIYDLGYLRALLCIGSFLVVFGIMMTSVYTQYYEVFLAQGVCVGIGSGCLFIPSIAVPAGWFTSKRAVATGIGVAGSSVGKSLFGCASSWVNVDVFKAVSFIQLSFDVFNRLLALLGQPESLALSLFCYCSFLSPS